MRDDSFTNVKKTVSEIENAIRARDVNSGIKAYNILRNYALDSQLPIPIRKLAYDKGMELHAILEQMADEIEQEYLAKHKTSHTEVLLEDTPVPLTTTPTFDPKVIIIVSMILLTIIGGSIFLIINHKIPGCNIDAPFSCKKALLKSPVSAADGGKNYIILAIAQSQTIINNITIAALSESLKGCKNVYLDNTYALSVNYNEIKIILECDTIPLSVISSNILLSYQSNGIMQSKILNVGREGLTNMISIEEIQKQRAATTVSEDGMALNCDLLPLKLDECLSYKCTFVHSFTEETMTKEIFGIVNNTCHYVEQMPYNGLMTCDYTLDTRKVIAQYYKDIASSKNSEITSSYTIGGKTVSNPIQEALVTGQCVVLGYNSSRSVSNCPNGTTYIGEQYSYKNDTKITKILCSNLTQV